MSDVGEAASLLQANARLDRREARKETLGESTQAIARLTQASLTRRQMAGDIARDEAKGRKMHRENTTRSMNISRVLAGFARDVRKQDRETLRVERQQRLDLEARSRNRFQKEASRVSREMVKSENVQKAQSIRQQNQKLKAERELVYDLQVRPRPAPRPAKRPAP